MTPKKFLISLFVLSLSSLPGLARSTDLRLTPVIYQVLGGTPQAVLGSDGEYHLVYELLVTNVSHQAWKVERLEALSSGKTLLKLEGAELESRIGSLGKRGGSSELGPQQSSVAWLHLKLPSQKDIPQKIQHRLSIKGGGKSMDVEGAEQVVNSLPALKIEAPLRGSNWLAGDGCCDSIRHVRALLPINGSLYLSQRFAIDWEKLDEGNKIYSGDPKNPESYFCYGQEVFAVADGEVVEMLDGLPNQVPGKLPDSIDLAQADGNHVILKLASGPYALYAHLKPGSVRVKRGDRIRAGQVLGLVGNSGNTSEPHLHFHLMDGPSAMSSNGIPYVLSSFQLSGHGASTADFDEAAAKGAPLKILPAKIEGQHQGQLPLDLSLVQFK